MSQEGQLLDQKSLLSVIGKIAERCVNVAVLRDVVTAGNGGQYINLAIPRAIAVASTTDGRYFQRVADQSKPVTGDDVLRLAAERAALPWETQTTLQVPRSATAPDKLGKPVNALRASDRVKPSVKEKSDDELLDHYQLAQGGYLTHLGILCLGQQHQRAQLTTAPVLQFNVALARHSPPDTTRRVQSASIPGCQPHDRRHKPGV